MKNCIKKLSEIVHEKDFDYDKLFRALAVAWLEKGTLQNAYNQINDVHPNQIFAQGAQDLHIDTDR